MFVAPQIVAQLSASFVTMCTFRAAVLQKLSVACTRHQQRYIEQYIVSYGAFTRATPSNSQHLTETLYILNVNEDFN